MSDEVPILDTSGLHCPQPLQRVKLALAELQTGQVLHVIATDPAAELDFKVFAAVTGHQLLTVETIDCKSHFFIQKS